MGMILKFFESLELVGPLEFLVLALSIFLGVFLYWRAGRHELHESHFLLDLGFFSVFGGLLMGRLFAFILEFESFNFSIYKLIFFHIFPGFNFWGFLTGLLVFGQIFLRRKKESVWSIFDFAAVAIVFSTLFFYLFDFITHFLLKGQANLVVLGGFVFNTILFITLKRLSAIKRHQGFFSGMYFLATGLFLGSVAVFEVLGDFDFKVSTIIKVGVPLVYAILGGIVSYKFSKRNLKNDLKGFFALLLLNLFNFKRAITSADEAGSIAKNVLFLPYFIFRLILVLLRMLANELSKTIWEFLYILGLKKY